MNFTQRVERAAVQLRRELDDVTDAATARLERNESTKVYNECQLN
jgi:hypothetical protein